MVRRTSRPPHAAASREQSLSLSVSCACSDCKHRARVYVARVAVRDEIRHIVRESRAVTTTLRVIKILNMYNHTHHTLAPRATYTRRASRRAADQRTAEDVIYLH